MRASSSGRRRGARKRSYHHGDLRAQLVQEARGQIETSFNFTIRDLARALGVTHAAAYRHFRSKRDILAAVAIEGFRGLEAALSAALEAPGRPDPRAVLKEQGIAYLSFARSHPGWFRAMFHPELADKSSYPELQSLAALTFSRLVQTIESGQRDACFRSGPVEVFSTAAWGLVHGVACLLLDQQLPARPDGKPIEIDVRSLWGGVADVLAEGLLSHGRRA